MNNPRQLPLRELMARLSDGTISTEESRQLNEILQADPIAQEQYLDHLLIDGLLEREFGAAPPLPAQSQHEAQPAIQPPQTALPLERFLRSRTVRRLLAPALLSILTIAFWASWDWPGGTREQPIKLANSGFEEGGMISKRRPSTVAWGGDIAEMVDRYAEITPVEGSQMLRFVESVVASEDACELYQIVELQDVADEIASGSVSVEASAFFNAIEEEDHSAFDITVFAFANDPATYPEIWPTRRERSLSFNGSQVRADRDTKSWQQVSARLNLPTDTRYLVVRLSVFRNDPARQSTKFPGQFADKVTLNLIGS